MKTRAFTVSQRAAFEQLLDDPSPKVRQALIAEFTRSSLESVDFLRELSAKQDHPLAPHAAHYLRDLSFADPVSEFRDFIRSLNYELETGAILLSRTVNPNLDVGACCTQLDALAARCRELIAEPASAREKCRVINRVLFHEHGLRGNTEHYADPLNSYIDQVLKRRKGIPISLSIIYILVAERIGLQLEAIALPGHFMVGCFEESVPFFIDTFNAGVFLTAEETFDFVKQVSGSASITDLAPTAVREVLTRCCRNLANHYSAARQSDQAALFAGFVAEFDATYERHAEP
ncbi:transglutaminase-like domain-containing protein [Oleiharenicola lentus]|uniref:transglutaminase-like domain-containing protein n=1 Tax=Oleiharenicola lentus TaxID=2508720 RepID=UPI003F674123